MFFDNNFRITKLTPTGTFLSKFGSFGTGDGQFTNISDVAVDSTGNIFAVFNSFHIQKFDSDGNFLLRFGNSGTVEGSFRSAHNQDHQTLVGSFP